MECKEKIFTFDLRHLFSKSSPQLFSQGDTEFYFAVFAQFFSEDCRISVFLLRQKKQGAGFLNKTKQIKNMSTFQLLWIVTLIKTELLKISKLIIHANNGFCPTNICSERTLIVMIQNRFFVDGYKI